MVSVKTKEDIPKGKIFDCVKALKNVEVAAPVHIGDVLVKDVAGTGVDVIATKNKGQIMKAVMADMKGKADGKVIRFAPDVFAIILWSAFYLL